MDKSATDNSSDFRAPRWIWGVARSSVAASTGMAAIAFVVPGPAWQRLFAALFVLFALLGTLELGQRRPRLDDEGVYFVHNLRGGFVPRASIESVTWAKGGSVSLKLASGGRVHLPGVGHGSLAQTNSIRAWSERTATSGA